MKIPYIEILDKYNLKTFALIEPSEFWGELNYYECGEFELYCRATPTTLNALKLGNYIKIPNKNYIWLIESVRYTTNQENGTKMIDVKGKEAKCIVGKRIIANPQELSSSLAVSINNLVEKNLGVGASDMRKIPYFEVGGTLVLDTITTGQAPRGNLLEYTEELLKTYSCAAKVRIENNKLVYQIYKGQDKTSRVIFSQVFDNLLSSEFYQDNLEFKSYAVNLSKIDDIEYISTYLKENGSTGIDRSEVYLESSLSNKYNDTSGEEQELDLTNAIDKAIYLEWLQNEAKTKLAELIIKTEINGVIDLKNSKYSFENDFNLGDIIKIKDSYFNFETDVRVLKFRISQKDIYTEEIEFGEV